MIKLTNSNSKKILELLKKFDKNLYIYNPKYLEVINTECKSDTKSNLFISEAPVKNPTLIIPKFKFNSQRKFMERFNLSYPYIAGAMAKGISSVKMVKEFSKNGFMADFGSAGLSNEDILKTADILKSKCKRFSINIINIPGNQENELKLLKNLVLKKINIITAGAYIRMTPGLVYFRVKGVKKENGKIIVPNKIIAKISRKEIAKTFMSPPPEKILKKLLKEKLISENEAELAKEIPISSDIICEADSGGHTDNQPAICLFPEIYYLKEKFQKNYPDIPIYLGLGGGISTPQSVLSAFSMGADFVVTGSINQSCIEAQTSDIVKEMLSNANQGDFGLAPSADTFESGGKVQVLKAKSMFVLRAKLLEKIYNESSSIGDIQKKDLDYLESKIFKHSLNKEWELTKKHFNKINPSIIEKAENNPKKKLALIFKSYLGQSSWWAIKGVEDRKDDFQIWSGPSMAAFNTFAKNTKFENFKNRSAPEIAKALLEGAGVLSRINFINNLDIDINFDLKELYT
ncbi:MAG: PfaD family polyunsaturated fatty acid/polyketide biosynthesis protein [Desulforegulaceae bacterium]|nr:PfaD family polyunsaturated fatty acid/polyketide biosynthesis protein [Desulforegulaceae bacterium]